MKWIKTFEKFEDDFNMIAWHTAFSEIQDFNPWPTWFTTHFEFAKAYHANSKEVSANVHTYKVRILGKILTQEEAQEFAKTINLDFEEIVTDLTGNPSIEERKILVEPFLNVCDGFFHWDYDPRDWGDGDSLIIFNPRKTVELIREVNL